MIRIRNLWTGLKTQQISRNVVRGVFGVGAAVLLGNLLVCSSVSLAHLLGSDDQKNQKMSPRFYLDLTSAFVDLYDFIRDLAEEKIPVSDVVVQGLIDYGFFLKAHFQDEDALWLSPQDRADWWQQWYESYEKNQMTDSDRDPQISEDDKNLIVSFVSVLDPLAELLKKVHVVEVIEELIAYFQAHLDLHNEYKNLDMYDNEISSEDTQELHEDSESQKSLENDL